jgi:transcriptional regulator with XRE-family HTH domain
MEQQGDRLRKARIKAGYRKLSTACKAFGWTYSTVANQENNYQVLTAEMAFRYAKVYNVTPQYLLYGDVNHIDNKTFQSISPYNKLKLLTLDKIVDGGLFLKDGSENYYQTIDAYPPDHYVIQMMGDAMVTSDPHISIPEGAFLIISPQDKVNIGDYVLIRDNNNVIIRKLSLDGTKKVLKAYNTNYRVIELTPFMKIIGRVVKIIIERNV